MRPERAARWLAALGTLLLLVLIVLRGISLVATKAAVTAAADSAVQSTLAEDAAQPGLGNYVFHPDGRTVFFQQESPEGLPRWYQLDVNGGQPLEGEPPQLAQPAFVLEEGELFARSANAGRLFPVSPQGVRVIAIAPSPDGQSVAFTGGQENQATGLYVLGLSGGLTWLGNAEDIRDVTWMPDGEWLVYVALADDFDQVFRIHRDGSEVKQLTSDPADKGRLVVSPDGSQIAYLSTANIQIIDPEGAVLHQVTPTALGHAGLHWVNNGRELAYVRSAGSGQVAQFLYAYDVDRGSERRIYPALAIERLDCPAEISRGEQDSGGQSTGGQGTGGQSTGGQGTVRLTVSSTALIPSSLPVVLRSGAQPFAPGPLADADERRKGAVRVESVDVPPGETKTVEWPVEPRAGITTYFSALIDDDTALFFSEANCSTRNTYMGMRALPFLPFTLPLLLPGLVLMVPWLRHQKKALMWGIWAFIPVAVAGLVVWELSLVG